MVGSENETGMVSTPVSASKIDVVRDVRKENPDSCLKESITVRLADGKERNTGTVEITRFEHDGVSSYHLRVHPHGGLRTTVFVKPNEVPKIDNFNNDTGSNIEFRSYAFEG